MDTSSVFGKKLRELRKLARLSLRELADRVNVNYSYISKIENGQLPPPAGKVIGKLAKALNADADSLLTLAGRMPRGLEQEFKNKIKTDFGVSLKKMRLKRNLSQQELARRTGVDATYISKIENGLVLPPSKKVIALLAEALQAKKKTLLTLAGREINVNKIRQKLQHEQQRGSAMSKQSFSPAILLRITVALILAVVVSAAIWSASPMPVKAIDINITNPATGTMGSTYTFTIQVDIQDQDRLPAQSVDLKIYNTANPGTYSVLFTNLPLPPTKNTSSTNNYSGAGGSAAITGTTGAKWGPGTAARYGYGYGYSTHATGTINLATDIGYGYGYAAFIGQTSITYTVVWTPPTNWAAGTYRIITIVYGNTGAKTKAFQNDTAAEFTLNALVTPSPTATPTPLPAGSTDVSGSINPAGVFNEPVTASSTDGSVTVEIDQGVVGQTAEGTALSQISVTPMASPPPPPADANVIGVTYNLGPTGATFNPPIRVTFTYDPASLPPGVDPADLVIAFYDMATGEWVELTNIVVDPVTNTISGDTSHFTAFAVVAPEPPAPVPTTPAPPTPTAPPAPSPTATPMPTPTAPPAPSPTATPAPTPTVKPAPTPTSTVIMPPPAPVEPEGNNWLWPGIIAAVVAILMVFVVRYGWNTLRRD